MDAAEFRKTVERVVVDAINYAHPSSKPSMTKYDLKGKTDLRWLATYGFDVTFPDLKGASPARFLVILKDGSVALQVDGRTVLDVGTGTNWTGYIRRGISEKIDEIRKRAAAGMSLVYTVNDKVVFSMFVEDPKKAEGMFTDSVALLASGRVSVGDPRPPAIRAYSDKDR